MCLLISKGIKHQTHRLSTRLRLLQMLLKIKLHRKKKSAVSRSNFCFFFPTRTLFNHSLIQKYVAAAAKSLQSCPTLCDPIDGSPPGSPVPGILQARVLE